MLTKKTRQKLSRRSQIYLTSANNEKAPNAAVKKFLRAVPNKFLQIASTIEQFGDHKTMTMEEVIGRLKAHEERLRGSGDVDEEHLLLTRAEWKERHKAENSSRG